MKKVILGLLIFGLAFQFHSFAQVVDLPEVEVLARNYKYLDDVSKPGVAKSVEHLQRVAMEYDVRDSEYYEDEHDRYFISFFIPEGKVLAAYDDKGNILRTVERYRNVAVPRVVSDAIARNYKGWKMAKNQYRVNYHDQTGVTRNEYRILLEKGNRRMRIKTDEDGNVI